MTRRGFLMGNQLLRYIVTVNDPVYEYINKIFMFAFVMLLYLKHKRFAYFN